MEWQVHGESSFRNYLYKYDGLGRLGTATYTDGTSKNFTEQITSYDKNGNIGGLKRYGQTGAATYGLIDDLKFSLTGNRPDRVDDASTATAYNGGFEFKDGKKQAGEYAYDANGNLIKDLNKGITGIQYNYLNLPSKVTFSDGSTIAYTYAADGMKLRTLHKVGSTTTTTDYCGNVIYENGVRKYLLTEEGYVSLNDGIYHYFYKDHLGNVRLVIGNPTNSGGQVEERNDYYPFGGLIADLGSVQPYKYNGKELDTKKGLNWYDYGARMYDAAVGRFTTPDQLAEKYYSLGLYVYCASNPIKYIDPTGADMVIWYKDEKGRQTSFSFNGRNAANAPQNSFVKDVIAAYDYNISNGGGENMQAVATDKKMRIGVVETGYDNVYLPNANAIRFNPTAGLKLDDGNILSPATGLEHEAAHAVNNKKGVDSKIDNKYGTTEERSVIKGAELKTAKANGELPANHPGRKSHADGQWVVTRSVISNKEFSTKSSEELRKKIKEFRNSYTPEP